jgi:outer membrane protein
MSVRLGLRLSLACLALFAAARTGFTQTTAIAPAKVAIINLQRAVLESAEIKKASAAMEAKYKPRQAEVEKLQKEIEALSNQLQTQANKLTPEAQANLQAQGQRKQRDLQRLGEDLQGEVDRERQEILSRATQKMQDVVKKYAEEKGIDVVVDVTNTIYFKPALEITTDVLAAYDKAYPAK